MGHQGIDRTLDLLQERVYWPSMAQDAQQWVSGCHHCQLAHGDYTGPKPKIWHLEANNPLDLVCWNFTKVYPSKSGKENVLVINDAFTKFSIAVCTPNQTAKTVAKVLVDKWFHTYGIPFAFTVTRVNALIQTSSKPCAKCMGLSSHLHHRIIHKEIHFVNDLIEPCLAYSRCLVQKISQIGHLTYQL